MLNSTGQSQTQLINSPPTQQPPEQTAQPDWTVEAVECAACFSEINAVRDWLIATISEHHPKLAAHFKIDSLDDITAALKGALIEAGVPEDDAAITEAIDDALERDAEDPDSHPF